MAIRKPIKRTRAAPRRPWKWAARASSHPLHGASPLPGFDQCFEHSPYIAFLCVPAGHVLAMNRHGRVLLGSPGSRTADALYVPWSARLWKDEALPAARHGGYWRGEMEMLGADGRLHPVLQVVEHHAATPQGPECLRCLCYALDDYNRFESRLVFKRLFEEHPRPMWVYDLDSLRFLVINQAAIRLYGYSEEEFLAMTIKDIRPPEDLPRLIENLATAPSQGADRAGLWTHITKDGSRLTVDISSHAVTIAGRAARFVFVHDVTEQLRMETALHASEQLQRLIINHIPHQIFWKDLDARYRGCNAVFARMAGLASNEEVVGKCDDDFPWAHNAERIRADDRQIVATNEALLNREETMHLADGSLHWFLINKLPLHDQRGNIIGVLGTIEDVSERKRAELTAQLHGRALEASVNAIVITAGAGADHRIDYANPAFSLLSGYCLDEVRGRDLDFLLGEQPDAADRTALRAALQSNNEVTMLLRNYHKDGRVFWSQLHVAPVRGTDDTVNHHVCVLTDLTETMNYQAQLEHQASHDALTGLPNRHLFGDRLEQAISYAQRYGHTVWIVFIDLDNFKLINDSLGHLSGDALLRAVAGRLRACMRESDTVARLGGDEFMLILGNAPDAPPIHAQLRRVLEAVSEPLALGERQVTITCSMGVSVYPGDGGEAQQLLKHADIAMYRAKEAGRNQLQFYEPAMNARIAERAMIEAELRHALARGQFSLHYQPKADLCHGGMTGLEALLRWQHPTLGMVSPARFISVAEETGLIVAIGRWVLRTACAQNQAWQRAGLAPLRMAVNLSARQFRDPGLLNDIIAALTDCDLQPQYLELELTESLMMHNVGEAVTVVASLKKLGVALSIDDFGTGYSSLAYLRLFPVDYLKIDQCFIRDMLGDPNVAAIVRSVIALGHSLHFKVVAEGVETEAQLAYLRRYQCDELQGYFYSRPMSTELCTDWLHREVGLPPAPQARPGRRTLLLLDDEPNILTALTRLLRRDGYTILRANTAAEAFELLAMHEVQVVVSDQRMPVMNGTEFLSRVKQLYPDTVRIILSGYTELESVLAAINRGEIFRFYTKPWDDQGLRDNIQAAFQYHQLVHHEEEDG